jgi:hypothetical protein
MGCIIGYESVEYPISSKLEDIVIYPYMYSNVTNALLFFYDMNLSLLDALIIAKVKCSILDEDDYYGELFIST